jgi:hypothetical protein
VYLVYYLPFRWYIGKRCPHEKRFSSNTGGEEEGKNWPVVESRRPAMFVSHSLFRPIQQQMGNTTMTNQEKYKKKNLLLLLLLLDFLSMGTDAGSLSIQQQQQQQRAKQKPGSSTHRR